MQISRRLDSHYPFLSKALLFSLLGIGCDVDSHDESPDHGLALDDRPLATPTPVSRNDDDDAEDDDAEDDGAAGGEVDPQLEFAKHAVLEGREIFRHETFGDEAFWGGALRLHEAIAGAANGGVGAGISPNTALALGLKIDIDALSALAISQLEDGLIDLDDPANTIAALEVDAVVGLEGRFDEAGQLTSIGVTCALCHSQVDDSFAPGIGHRLDGWPNRDLDVGAIMAAAPDLSAVTTLLGVDDPTLRTVMSNWGVGKFDAFVQLDGIATRPDGTSGATLIPPLFGLAGVGLMTWNAFGSLSSWIPVVINIELHGKGSFRDPRLANAQRYPVAAANDFDRISNEPDLVSDKLVPLELYILSMAPPEPPAGSFDSVAAEAGEALFQEHCAGCHVPPLYTPVGWGVIPGFVVGVDSFQSNRSPNLGYRPPPLRGLFTRTTGGFFHDGRFATLADVVDHFDALWALGLAPDQKYELVEFLKSL